MDKILIADDNVQITRILSEFAKKEGFEPVTAHDGEEVIKLFQQYRFSIILLDVMMPKKDGFEDHGAGYRRRRLCRQAVFRQ